MTQPRQIQPGQTQSGQSRSHTHRPELFACLHAREFPAQAMLRLRPHLRPQPVAILQGEAPRQFVCSHNARAHALGVRRGMTRAELEVFPTVILLPRSTSEEATARTALLQAAGRFSPRVEDRSDGTCFCALLDIAGTEKLFGPPEKLGKDLLQSTRALGLHAAVVASVHLHAALCVARSVHNRIMTLPPGGEAAALAPLPLSVLDLTPEHAEILARWGIGTLGALASLPEKELVARLGQEGLRLRQLARGEAPHLLVPAEPVFSLEERMELDSPVELLDSLLFVLGVLLDHLIARATAQILALASVTVQLTLEGGAIHSRTVRPALPGNDRSLWLRLLHLDLQAHPPQAPILSVSLSAEPGSTSKVQLGLFSPQLPEPTRLDVTLARIRALVGDGQVGRAVLEDTHRPDAFRVEPFAISTGSPPPAAPRGRTNEAIRRFRPPEPVTVVLRQRQPAFFVFRNTRYRVERAYGPWCSSGDWWGSNWWAVEKWDLVAHADDRSASGTVLCCCLSHHPLKQDWRIEALYD